MPVFLVVYLVWLFMSVVLVVYVSCFVCLCQLFWLFMPVVLVVNLVPVVYLLYQPT